MDESEDNTSSDIMNKNHSGSAVKIKPKKRSLVERELETSLTARLTSPVLIEGTSTSRYGRARRLKTLMDFTDTNKAVTEVLKSPKSEKTPVKTSPVYKMHAANSPVRTETPPKQSTEMSLENQIENIYNANISLSRFGSDEKKGTTVTPAKKFPKVYTRKDLIQTKEKEKEETIMLIKNMFSPVKSTHKPTNSHLSNTLERSSEKYYLHSNVQANNGFLDTSSVVKTLDFDGNKKKKKENRDIKPVLPKSELFELEAKCEYQVGDLAWARMGTYPFWPCIVTREPSSDMFVKKKLFGRNERDVINVTFFSDNGRHSWVVGSMMRRFLGQQEFEAAREQFTPEAKKKDPRLYAAFFVSDKKQALWNTSVQEAEMLLREPKRLRIDLFYDMLERSRMRKLMPKVQRSEKKTRTNSDVSLSESLYDTLFSEDDGKIDEVERARAKRNKSLDVSEVVTACLDNMAAKTGLTQIQKQSHMDRWLQKAKTKTPEKSQIKVTITVEEVDEKNENAIFQGLDEEIKGNSANVVAEKKTDKAKDSKKKKKAVPKNVSQQKPYSLRKSSANESQNLLPYHNEHDYSSKPIENIISFSKSDDIVKVPLNVINVKSNEANDEAKTDISVIEKVETHCKEMLKNKNEQTNVVMTMVDDILIMNENVEGKADMVALNNEKVIDNIVLSRVMDVDALSPKDSHVCTADKITCSDLELTNNLYITENTSDQNVNNNEDVISKDLYNEDQNSVCKHTDEKKVTISKEAEVIVVESKEISEQSFTIGITSTELYVGLTETDKNKKSIPKQVKEKELEATEVRKQTHTSRSMSKKVCANSTINNKGGEVVLKQIRKKVLDTAEVIKECLPSRNINSEVCDDKTKIYKTVLTKGDKETISKQVEQKISEKSSKTSKDSDVYVDFIENNTKEEAISKKIEEKNGELIKRNENNLINSQIYEDLTKIVETKDGSSKQAEKNELECIETNKKSLTNGSVDNEVNIYLTKPFSIDDTSTDDDLTDCESHDNSFIIEDSTDQILTEIESLTKELTKCDDSVIRKEAEAINYKPEKTPSIHECTQSDDVLFSAEKNDNSQKSDDPVKSDRLEMTASDKGNENKLKTGILAINREDKTTPSQDNLRSDVMTCSEEINKTKSIDSVTNDIAETKICNNIDIKLSSRDKTLENHLIETCSQDGVPIKNSEQSLVKDTDHNVSSNKEVTEMMLKNMEVQNDYGSFTENEIKMETAGSEEEMVDEYQSYLIKDSCNISTTKDIITKESNIEITSMDPIVNEASLVQNDAVPRSNGLSEPVVNGFYGDLNNLNKINDAKIVDSDTASVSSELDNVTLKELKLHSRKLQNEKIVGEKVLKVVINAYDIIENREAHKKKLKLLEGQGESETQTTKNIKLSLLETELKTETDNEDQVVDYEIPLSKRKLRSRISNSPSEIIKGIGYHDTKDSDNELKKEIDSETASINSEDSGVSLTKRKPRKDRQASNDKKEDRTQDPEFLKYLEFRQDTLIDEHPELTQEEIVSYLYKTWLYEESFKSDIKKTDDIEQSSLVKGINQEPTRTKQTRKRIKTDKKKVIDIDKVMSEEPRNITDYGILQKDKPKRKTSVPYYNEDYSDIEDEIAMFEIFKKKPTTSINAPKNNSTQILTPKTEAQNTVDEIKVTEANEKPSTDVVQPKTETLEIVDGSELNPEEFYDEVELYFEQLTQPKPNIFRGLVREKVCEVCENRNDLVKCKGCNGMFHVDCVKKKIEVVEVPVSVRKKKKGRKGRKPKMSTDSNGLDSESHSDDKSHDANASGENNLSVDSIEPETHTIVDAESFEAKLAEKMKELLEITNNVQYDSYSSDDGLDWSDTEAGNCQIVDIKLKSKREDDTDFKCKNCQKYDIPVCFICKSDVSPKDNSQVRQRCQVAHCHKYYHLACLDIWPQTQFNSGEPSRNNKKISEHFEALTCPRHVCHTCVSDDPRGCKTRFSGDKLARCVRCPATYHSFTKCLPAGTQILTASHILCPRHYEHRPGRVPCHVNTGWCFICALGGSLICCEYCPTSFHAECLNIKPPEGGYMCEDCETGRLPLYGEMVWVKLGHYRWWPGIILHPSEIPPNIMAVKHCHGEFVVRFFGQYDHYWVNRGRVFPFQEGDTGRISGQRSKIDEAFTLAIQHAYRAYEILKNVEPNEEESLDIASSLLPPHYVKLKVNKPCGSLCGRRVDVEESSLTQCECNPDEEDPCGPYSHCLNRMLLTECGPTCRAGERCNNRAFEKRLYPKLVPYRTPHRGWGLKTLEDIKAGQFVIEYVGELIDEEEFKRRMCRKHEIRDENFYFLTLDKERMIDAGPKGNLARFMNHCCEPNCETQKWTVLGDVRVGLFAIRDIPANSEVTFNYNLECAGIEKKRCLCGAKRCSGYIGAKPKQDEPQPKKPKRTYKKRKNIEESPSTSKSKPKRPIGRPAKPRELTEIEKDLLIIRNATNGLSSDSEGSGRLNSIDNEEKKDAKALKRKRVSFSTEEIIIYDGANSPSVKKMKWDEEKTCTEVGD